jgi:GDPmannose 4,6-dehydratase
MSKRALITGAAGQDGTWLAAQLIDAGWQVFGVVHPLLAAENLRLKSVLPAVEQLPASVADLESLSAAFTVAQPDCVWHLAAIASPTDCEKNRTRAIDTNIGGTLNVLLMAQAYGASVIFASTNDVMYMRGEAASTYAITKRTGHDLVVQFRERDGLAATNAVLWNHMSPAQGTDYILPKIARAAVDAAADGAVTEFRGSLDSTVDIGHGQDVTRALMVLADAKPGDYEVGSGVALSLSMYCRLAFDHVGIHDRDWREFVRWPADAKPSHARQAETSKLRELGWVPGWTGKAVMEALVDGAQRTRQSQEARA